MSYFKTSYPGREVRYLIYNIINNSFQSTDKYSRKALVLICFRLSQNLEFFIWSLAGILKHCRTKPIFSALHRALNRVLARDKTTRVFSIEAARYLHVHFYRLKLGDGPFITKLICSNIANLSETGNKSYKILRIEVLLDCTNLLSLIFQDPTADIKIEELDFIGTRNYCNGKYN